MSYRICCKDCEFWEEIPTEGEGEEPAGETDEGAVIDFPGLVPSGSVSEDQEFGTCHKHPPAPQCMCPPQEDGTMECPWPITPEDEWCGDAEVRKEEE